MKVGNIDHVMLFQTSGGQVLTQEKFAEKFGFEPDGANEYYGLNQANLTNFESRGVALNPSHEAFFRVFLDSLQNSEQPEKTVVLGLEPSERNSFDFVAAHMDVVRSLARELAARQAEARDRGKQLRIVVRYASEMNDPQGDNNTWGGHPDAFKRSFEEVRTAFREEAPEILFAFSPAIRADVNEDKISDYWPGDSLVDIIAGTWYIHGEEQSDDAKRKIRQYFLHRLGTGKPFALDELSGRERLHPDNQPEGQNDRFIQAMLEALFALREEGVALDYVTLFLELPWGRDARLRFLSA
jgi:hypothetical protein